jgi:hypothetical protein
MENTLIQLNLCPPQIFGWFFHSGFLILPNIRLSQNASDEPVHTFFPQRLGKDNDGKRIMGGCGTKIL